MEVLIYRCDWGVVSKVDADSLAHDGFAVEDGADADGIFFGFEGCDDAAEGFQWRPGVDVGRLVDEVAERLEVVWVEDGLVVEIGDEEGVCWWRRLDERRDVGEVKAETRLVRSWRGPSAIWSRDRCLWSFQGGWALCLLSSDGDVGHFEERRWRKRRMRGCKVKKLLRSSL